MSCHSIGLAVFPPVIVGLIKTGKAPSAFMIIGFLLCVAAVLIVSMVTDDNASPMNVSNTTSLSSLQTTVEPKGIDENSNFDVAIGFFLGAFTAWSVQKQCSWGLLKLKRPQITSLTCLLCVFRWFCRSASTCISSFVATSIPLLDRCVMWTVVELTLGFVRCAPIGLFGSLFLAKMVVLKLIRSLFCL